MSVETLHEAERAAGIEIGLDPHQIEEILRSQATRIVPLGELAIQTSNGKLLVPAWRGISGPDDSDSNGDPIFTDKGGSRMTTKKYIKGDLQSLPEDMRAKVSQTGLVDINGKPLNGGKLLFQVDPGILEHSDKIQVFQAAALAMLDAGIAGYNRSVPAGDMGTNHPHYMNAFANVIKAQGDPYWQGSITGKSPGEMWGLEFRQRATGHGVAETIGLMAEEMGVVKPTVTIIGAGNVAAWTGYYLTRNNSATVRAIKDINGTVIVENEIEPGEEAMGIEFTEELIAVMDNPNFKNDPRFAQFATKELAIMHIASKQPGLRLKFVPHEQDPNAILKEEADIIVPAAAREVINESNVKYLRANAICEAGNDSIDSFAFEYLKHHKPGMYIIPGTIANAGGVASSMEEQFAGILRQRPSFEESEQRANAGARTRFYHLRDVANELDTNDYNMAAYALGMISMALQADYEVDSRFVNILKREYSLTV